MDKKSKLLFHNFGDVFVIYSIPNISIVETSCYEQHFRYHTREKCLSRDMGFFPEKIVLLKQLSGSTNSLIMITLNHLVIQNESHKLVLEINSVTKQEIPTFDEKGMMKP